MTITETTAVHEPDRVVSYSLTQPAGDYIGSVWVVPGGYAHSAQAPGAPICVTLRQAVAELQEGFA